MFAMFIMPKLKVDPEEMKEMLGQKETAPRKGEGACYQRAAAQMTAHESRNL